MTMLIEMFVVRIVEMIMMLTCSGGDGDGDESDD